jgi:hypothetical protein
VVLVGESRRFLAATAVFRRAVRKFPPSAPPTLGPERATQARGRYPGTPSCTDALSGGVGDDVTERAPL